MEDDEPTPTPEAPKKETRNEILARARAKALEVRKAKAAEKKEMADMIIKLLRNPNILKKFGTNGNKIVSQNFTLNGMLRKHRNIFNSFNLNNPMMIVKTGLRQ